MRLDVLRITDVPRSHLCCGCGACVPMTDGAIEMVDTLDGGRRPRASAAAITAAQHAAALAVCPGVSVAHDGCPPRPSAASPAAGWGPVLEVWEGYATDPRVRHLASSGGAATALGQFALEQGGMHGVLHVAARRDVPYLNETVLSTTVEALRQRSGSRYAPASPADGLGRVESAPRPCVFIGKPCDVAAARRAAMARPRLAERLGLTIGVFCAGTPTTRGTLELLREAGVDDPSSLVALRYRGRGWPGETVAIMRTAEGYVSRRLSYERSWGEVLTKHKQWRCKLCADHTAEFADLAVGDAWHRRPGAGEPGRSLIVVRTERGRAFLAAAVRAGSLQVRRVDVAVLSVAQPQLLQARAAVWGRLLALRLMGLPRPRYRGLPLFGLWWTRLTLRAKVGSVLGTIRRACGARLRRPERLRLVRPPVSTWSRPRPAPVEAVPAQGAAPLRRAA